MFGWLYNSNRHLSFCVENRELLYRKLGPKTAITNLLAKQITVYLSCKHVVGVLKYCIKSEEKETAYRTRQRLRQVDEDPISSNEDDSLFWLMLPWGLEIQSIIISLEFYVVFVCLKFKMLTIILTQGSK